MKRSGRKKMVVRFSIAAVIVYVGILFIQQQSLIAGQAAEREQLQAQLNESLDTQEMLKGQILHADTPESIMKAVREKLGWVAPDEILFVEDPAAAEPTPTPEDAQ